MSSLTSALKSGLTCTILLTISLLTAGCLSPGGSQTAQAVDSGKPVSLAVIYVTTPDTGAGFGDESRHLNDAMVSRLVESEMFNLVTNQPPGPDASPGIKLAAEIKRLKKVSANARNWTGILAGRAELTAQVSITDLQTGRPLRSFTVEAQSGRDAYGATTDEAIDRAAREIASQVIQLNSRLAEKEGL